MPQKSDFLNADTAYIDGAALFSDEIPGGAHWSLTIKADHVLRLIDRDGGANVGMLFYNPHNLLERYNAPDTLKCQHTLKLTRGHCLYSDMAASSAPSLQTASVGTTRSPAPAIKRW